MCSFEQKHKEDARNNAPSNLTTMTLAVASHASTGLFNGIQYPFSSETDGFTPSTDDSNRPVPLASYDNTEQKSIIKNNRTLNKPWRIICIY